jgi:hypothetical protein|tara:strand:- start:321 stop:524 length:204 start_codon:yes stop_codon:yes gene_type:complete
MRHITLPDETRRIRKTIRIPIGCRPQEQGRGVYGTARNHHDLGVNALDLSIPLNFDSNNPTTGRISK